MNEYELTEFDKEWMGFPGDGRQEERNRILAALLAYSPADDLLDTGGSYFDEAKLRALLFPN